MCKAASGCANNHESCFEAVKNIINLEIVEMSCTVNVYDSALPAWWTKYVSTANGKVFEKSLAILLSNNYSEITVESVKCTQQRGVTACGLYATAHATGLCCGQDQVTVLYDQAVVRNHLLCFKAGKMHGFTQGD